MKIYTRTGDHGETGLLGGVRVAKNHLTINACGELDETNSQLGLARSHGLPSEMDRRVTEIQADLFVLGSQVAASLAPNSSRAATLPANRIVELEQQIDRFEEALTPMDAFILPGGCTAAAQLHVARTVCRRAERCLVEVNQKTGPGDDIAGGIVYLNRLSDLLFVMARFVNQVHQSPETKWLPK